MLLGIIQGRLSKPLASIQEFPQHWQREFSLVRQLKLSHIEWILTNTSPICTLSPAQKKIVSSICVDTLINKKFNSHEWVKNTIQYAINYSQILGITHMTLPFLEESAINNNNISAIQSILQNVLKHNISISLETSLTDPLMLIDVASINPLQISITYDTGNMTPINHEAYLNTIMQSPVHITNIHLKDKNIDNQSVPPGKGSTDFRTIFKVLKKYQYHHRFTMQFARGQPGKENTTIQTYKRWVLNKWENS